MCDREAVDSATSAGTVFRGDQRAMRQFLQHLGHERSGDAILLGNLVGAASMLLAVHRQMLDGNQPVVGLLGKLKHRRETLYSLEYATESVAHEVYPQKRPKVNPQLLLVGHITRVFLATYSKTRLVLFPSQFQQVGSRFTERQEFRGEVRLAEFAIAS
jgi:hypothetical protein